MLRGSLLEKYSDLDQSNSPVEQSVPVVKIPIQVNERVFVSFLNIPTEVP